MSLPRRLNAVNDVLVNGGYIDAGQVRGTYGDLCVPLSEESTKKMVDAGLIRKCSILEAGGVSGIAYVSVQRDLPIIFYNHDEQIVRILCDQQDEDRWSLPYVKDRYVDSRSDQ